MDVGVAGDEAETLPGEAWVGRRALLQDGGGIWAEVEVRSGGGG